MPEHHEPLGEQAARNLLLDQFLNKSQPSYPAGKLNEKDDGEIAFAVAANFEKNVVILRFGKAVDWVGLPAYLSAQLGSLLVEKARQLKEHEHELKKAADQVKR